MSEQKTKEIRLTGKQKLFADFYLGEANLTGYKAAKLAGYNGTYCSLKEIAYQNLKKPNVRAYIDQQLSALTMSAHEVLARLADIAGSSIEDLLDDDGKFDYKLAKKRGKLNVVKKLKRKTTTKALDGEEAASEINEEVEFEMYSAHEALRDLGKYHKLFADRIEHTGAVGTYVMSKEEWEREAAEKLASANQHLEQFDDE